MPNGDSDRGYPAEVLTPGEVRMALAEGLDGFILRYEREDPVSVGRRRHVSIHTLCVQTTDVADLIGPDSAALRPE